MTFKIIHTNFEKVDNRNIFTSRGVTSSLTTMRRNFLSFPPMRRIITTRCQDSIQLINGIPTRVTTCCTIDALTKQIISCTTR